MAEWASNEWRSGRAASGRAGEWRSGRAASGRAGEWRSSECQSGRVASGRMRLKCDGTRAETRFRLSAKRTSPFKSAVASVHSTTVSRGVRISGSNAGYTMFRGSVKGTGYPLRSPVSPSLPLPCVTACHHISTGLYRPTDRPTQRVTNSPFPLVATLSLLPRASRFLPNEANFA